MKFFFSPYTLKPMSNVNAVASMTPRDGSLLKVVWPHGAIGYADIHPWPELGDADLKTQLTRLKNLKLTPLLEQSIWLAKRDAQARHERVNLFPAGMQLKNNFVIPDVTRVGMGDLDEAIQRGFGTLKIKCGRDLDEEVKMINRVAGRGDFRLRLDFNAATTATLFEKFIAGLGKRTLSYIDYVEDPFPYDHEAWREVRATVKIAIDYEAKKMKWNKENRPSCDVVILKPARMDVEKVVEAALHWHLKMTVTSSMDHPVGVMHAVCIALDLKKKHDQTMLEAGCMTLRQYQMDAFSAAVPVNGPYFQKPRGTGIGFDDLLEQRTWTPISTV